jgi:hypothetical protein
MHCTRRKAAAKHPALPPGIATGRCITNKNVDMQILIDANVACTPGVGSQRTGRQDQVLIGLLCSMGLQMAPDDGLEQSQQHLVLRIHCISLGEGSNQT